MISKLIQQGDRPVCVISKKGDRFVTLRKILGDIKYSLVGGKRKYLENIRPEKWIARLEQDT
jgi:hypothetical protein